jgi:hypothetical protein
MEQMDTSQQGPLEEDEIDTKGNLQMIQINH